MEFNKHKIKKFVKKSAIDSDPLPNKKDEKLTKDGKILSNIEAFELGKFPDNLIEKVSLPEIDRKDYIDREIKPKHLELLENRPVPEMLENSKLVGKLKQIDSLSLGKFYEEKKVDEAMKKEKYPNKT